MKVKVKTYAGIKYLQYTYDCSPDIGFQFNLLSEVGAPWQLEAKTLSEELAASRGATIARGLTVYEDQHGFIFADVLVPHGLKPYELRKYAQEGINVAELVMLRQDLPVENQMTFGSDYRLVELEI